MSVSKCEHFVSLRPAQAQVKIKTKQSIVIFIWSHYMMFHRHNQKIVPVTRKMNVLPDQVLWFNYTKSFIRWLDYIGYWRIEFIYTSFTSLIHYLLSRDRICMPKLDWSTNFLSEFFDSNFPNLQVWSSSKSLNGPKSKIRKVCDRVATTQFEYSSLVPLNSSNWTKLAYLK